MPKLLAFIVCQKTIIEKQHETPSLISVLQKVQFGITETSMPADAMAPFPWSIFTIWDRDDDRQDVGKTFLQKGDVLLPDGSSSAFKIELPFVVKDQLNFTVINMMGFPVGQLGVIRVKLWLESENGELASEHYYYPIVVENLALTAEGNVEEAKK